MQPLAFAPGGEALAASNGSRVTIWAVGPRKVLAVLGGHAEEIVDSVAFSPDGKTLATGGRDRTVKLWDLATYAERETMAGHKGWIWGLAFSPDGRTLAVGGGDSTVKFRDVAAGRWLDISRGPPGGTLSVAFSPDGKTLATGHDPKVVLWRVPE